MGVVEPTGTGVGGDLMAVVATGEAVAVLNGSGRSGRSTDPESVPDNGHGFVPSVGGCAVTVPGAVAAWEDLHRRFGRLPWPALFEPAIEAAAGGAAVGATGSRLWEGARSRLDTAGESLYFGAGTAPAPGERWRNPNLAAVLEQIAADGPEGLYRGPLAQAIAAAATAAGGSVRVDDLADHRSQWVEPLRASLGNHELVTVPPPCQGAVTALAAQWVHDRSLLGATGGSAGARAAAAMVEAFDRAFAVALDCLADPDAADVPHHDEMRARMAAAPRHGPMPLGPGTVFTVVFTADQAVVLTSSVCDRFGSGITVPEGGFVLQSRGRGFSTDLSHPNAVAPGKRPYHTIVPTLVMENGRPMLGMGVVGGIMQPQGQLQILHRVLGGAGLVPAVNAARFRLIGEGRVTTEASLEPEWRAEIGAAGYDLVTAAEVIGGFGGAQAVLRAGDTLTAASDPRRDGTSAVITLPR
jgi:gamma-glutamyltranspeptidase/glutathione hydrolase